MAKLTTKIEVDSHLLKSVLPIEIRDGSMQLIETVTDGDVTELDPGLYHVSATLDDGRTSTSLVQLNEGDERPVHLRKSVDMPKLDMPARAVPFGLDAEVYGGPKIELPLDLKNFSKAPMAVDLELAAGAIERLNLGAGQTELPQVLGANLVESDQGRWLFGPTDERVVATATFLLAGERITVSLPVNPLGDGPRSQCEVILETRFGQPRLNAWIKDERIVSSALQRMLANQTIYHLPNVVREATDQMRDKYQDPVGAALGAIILSKMGMLEDRMAWLENLANDFSWIADGKVLLAEMLFQKRAEPDRAERLALEATQSRLLFTESRAILSRLLRQWPKESISEVYLDLSRMFFVQNSYFDWSATTLTSQAMEVSHVQEIEA